MVQGGLRKMMAVIKNMKEKIPNHPVLKKEMEKLMTDGLSQDEALNVMINAWLDSKVIDDVNQYCVAFVYVCNLGFVWKNLYTTEEN